MCSQPPAGAGRLPALMLGALGVVYGDIGTSPLYTLREAFLHSRLPLTAPSILGILSLAFWALILVVTLKYVLIVMRADNRGEGGVLALGGLAQRALNGGRRRGVVVALAMLGVALFYGDSLITPAISVLSAVEGLRIVAPALSDWVVPLTMIVLVGLFLVQRQGTGQVGRVFGPVMLVWFLALAVLGLIQIVQAPEVLHAVNPVHAVVLFINHGWIAALTLGAVVLAVTGAEALYADMGHFGKRPIRLVWTFLVLPALVMNYFGQGALLLHDQEALENPFYHLAPDWAQAPLVVLATMAAVIASQAVISGAFSLTRQAVQLGYLPRREVRHTSAHEIGQIYIPRNNWMMLAGTLALVAGFGSSGNLAAAYGVSVTGAMLIDTLLLTVVAWQLWRWPPIPVAIGAALLLVIDLALFGSTLLKVTDGGWLPLMIAAIVFVLMSTWRQGRNNLYQRLYADALPVEQFLERVSPTSPLRVAGTAVFLTGNASTVPHALLHNLKHNKVMHERMIILTVRIVDEPRINDARRMTIERLGKGFHRIVVTYGYMERPDLPRALERARSHGLHLDPMDLSYFLGRETLIPAPHKGIPRWQEPLYIIMSKTALSATEFFCLPPNRVVELGTQIEI